jgi:hypothetical protein
MIPTGTKRSYIHRKKYLNESVAQIKVVLEFIRLARKDPGSPESSHKVALEHAQSIEAVCWSPHSRLTADVYQRIMAAKTQELCRMLLRNALPTIDLAQLSRIDPRLAEDPAPPPLPVPVFPTAANSLEGGWPGDFPALETEGFDSELRDMHAGLSPFEGSGADHEPYFRG